MKLNRAVTSSVLILSTILVGCGPMKKEATASFDVYSSVYDYGARIDKVVIESPVTLDSNSIDKDTFKISSNNKSNANLKYENGERVIKNIYVSDTDNGNKSKEGKYIIAELDTTLNSKYADVLQWNDAEFTNVPLTIEYNVTQNKEIKSDTGKSIQMSLSQDKFIQNVVDDFGEGKSKEGLHYRDYQPKKDGKKHPLVIWLHGAGEGGENNVTHINGNRGAVAFTTDKAKQIFDDPYILAPQSPDYWMTEFKVGNIVLKGTNNTEKVVSLIKEYISNHKEIDEKRVYIGGCSMGGYQTWETLFAAPELFAAAFPICAAYDVPVEKMNAVKDIPIWLVHAEIDDTVPVQYSRNAYKHMKELGGKINYTEYPKVQVEGQDFAPHGVWVYALNNMPKTEDGKTYFEWIASQTK